MTRRSSNFAAGKIETGKASRGRSGVILAMVLIVLLVVSLICAALVQAIVDQHRQAVRDQQRRQNQWFAESAVQRAVQALAASADYSGEEWQIAAGLLEVGQPDVAKIAVQIVPGSAVRRRVRVELYEARHKPQQVVYRVEREVQVPK